MKRIVVLALLLVVLVSGAFAVDKTIGFGAMYNHYFMGGYGWDNTRTGFGAFGFFGLSQYFEANLGMSSTSLESGDSSLVAQVGLYFKYPFVISDNFVFFPTVGADFQYGLDWEIQYLWPRAGVGLDIFFTEKLFLRSHLIYGMGIIVIGEHNNLDYYHGALIKVGLGWMF
jgi:hypothetical protein